MRPSFFHHLHPPTIPAPQARFRYTLGAGGLSVFLVLVLIATGILEMFFYIPTPEKAAVSIQLITFLAPFGSLVRGLHYWAAQLLTVTAAVHLLRVVFTGGYAPPRRFNYLLGLGAFLLILGLNFSGYILRWDEGIRWALVVGTNLLKTIPWLGAPLYGLVVGGPEPGGPTLIRFYAWHIFGLTLLAVVVIVWHLFRVRRDGGIAVPPPDQRPDRQRIERAGLVRREGLAALLAAAALVFLAAFAPAPLAPGMGSSLSPLPDARAPWFFLWIQDLLRYGNAFWVGVMIPLGLLILLALVPYLLPLPRPEELGRWFPRHGRLAQILVAGSVALILGLTIHAWLTLGANP